ncbi:MAG: hypothetical protein HGA19_22440, partial [Oscillochloris sp.]|nr:hypothetical protein [Oscillochloris sp.]
DLMRYTAQPAGGRRLARTIAQAAGAYVADLSATVDDLLARVVTLPNAPLAQARFVFIFDGFDDVQRQLREPIARELLDLASDGRLALHRFVLSCRRDLLPSTLAPMAQLLVLRYLNGREVLRYLRSCGGSFAQANTRFGQILDAQLLDLAALPPMLAVILQRIEGDRNTSLTRNQLLQDALDLQLAKLPIHFQRGDAARQSLMALASEMSWQPDEAIDINRAFAILAEVRRERAYNLEDLYDQLCTIGLLYDVDRRRTTFQRPGQRAYCAALALRQRSDIEQAIDDLLPQCAVVERAERWKDVLISLAGMLDSFSPLLRIVRAARATNNGLYMVLLARCIQALPGGMFEELRPRDRGALLDACAAWADPAREPSAVRRAQIAESLGCLPDAASVRALLRLSCERIRPAIERRLDFEYTSVRLSAAFGLCSLMMFRPPTRAAGALIWRATNQKTIDALQAWAAAGNGNVASLRQIIQSLDMPLEARLLAVIALADLANDDTDMRHLLRQITAPPPPGRPDDWDALIRTVADALTLCDARRVAALLGQALRHPPPLHNEAIGQIIYLAGRVRTHDPDTLRWLIEQFVSHSDMRIKAKALRSLAWIISSEPALALSGALLGPPLLDAACWIGSGLLNALVLPLPIGAISMPASDDSSGITYLRRTALECLRWLPGDIHVAELTSESEHWPIELRRALACSVALRT